MKSELCILYCSLLFFSLIINSFLLCIIVATEATKLKDKAPLEQQSQQYYHNVEFLENNSPNMNKENTDNNINNIPSSNERSCNKLTINNNINNNDNKNEEILSENNEFINNHKNNEINSNYKNKKYKLKLASKNNVGGTDNSAVEMNEFKFMETIDESTLNNGSISNRIAHYL